MILSIEKRLESLENQSNADFGIALMFVRQKTKEDDFSKQHQEFQSIHGDDRKVTFLAVTDYGSDPDEESYDNFIQRNRLNSGNGNCFNWWPEIEEETETDKEVSDVKTKLKDKRGYKY